MQQLDLAMDYLEKRAISTENVNNKLIKECISVIPTSEVLAVLNMVKTGDFIDFYNNMKELGHNDFMNNELKKIK